MPAIQIRTLCNSKWDNNVIKCLGVVIPKDLLNII